MNSLHILDPEQDNEIIFYEDQKKITLDDQYYIYHIMMKMKNLILLMDLMNNIRCFNILFTI